MGRIIEFAPTRPLPLSGLSAAARALRCGLSRLIQNYKNRREAEALADFDDRMLADIGLTRGDLRDAYAQPFWRDPTELLALRVNERRQPRRRSSLSCLSRMSEAPSLMLEKGFKTPPPDRQPRHAW